MERDRYGAEGQGRHPDGAGMKSEPELREPTGVPPYQLAIIMRNAAQIMKIFETCGVLRMNYEHIELTLDIVKDAVRRAKGIKTEVE